MNLTRPYIFTAHSQIIKIIDSCVTYRQIAPCRRLIANFRDMYKDYNHLSLLTAELRLSLESKTYKLTKIL
jgi:hypothetical protein